MEQEAEALRKQDGGEINASPFANPVIAAGYEAWYHTIGRRADRQEKALLRGLLAVGLDLYRPMLDEAVSLSRPVYLRGDALALPFLSKSFDLVAQITTLEFLPEPLQALAEALRVARQGIILGVLNADSCLGREYKLAGGPIWEAARFFTPDELICMIRRVAGEKTRVIWRTTLWPFWPGTLPLPWGGFIGMAVKI
ncbi:MAG: class I SAM-dependent methyltransferase [Anaerolineales bacterium]